MTNKEEKHYKKLKEYMEILHVVYNSDEDTHDYQDGLLKLKQLNKEINELVEHIDE